MKKNSKQKLVFNKSAVTELQGEALKKINGGTLLPTNPLGCTLCINSSNGPGNISIFQEYLTIIN